MAAQWLSGKPALFPPNILSTIPLPGFRRESYGDPSDRST